jgi:hypothetical protein
MQTRGASKVLGKVLFISYIAVIIACIALPLSAFGADKLVVKDTGGNTKFVATDEGKVGIGITSPGQALSVAGNVGAIYGGSYVGAFGTSDVRNAWFSRNAHFDTITGWQRFDATSYAVLDQQVASATNGEFQIYTAAPGSNPISNWTKQFSVKINGDTFINGNVGIGTAAPSQKLEVNGGVRLNTASAKPAICDSSARGTFWFDQTGTDDTVFICARISGLFAWKKVTLQ